VNNTSSSKVWSATRRSRKIVAAIEGLESRSYLTGVVFGAPVNTSAASAGINPVYANLDKIVSTNQDNDLIVANVANSAGVNNSISVLPGNGNGTFGAAHTIPLTFSPLTIRTGALVSGSSNIDIVVGSTSGSTFGVILNNGGGSLTEHDYTATGLSDTQSVAIGDFNGDGHPDIAVASDDNGTSNNVAIFMNDGTGHFGTPQILSLPHSQLASITAFTAGGVTDLAVADASSNAVTVLTNNGSGNFASPVDYAVGSEPVTITDGQFGPGSNDDLVTANATGGSVSVLPGNGDGSFGAAKTTPVPGAASNGGPLKVRMANLNGDAFPDLICLLSSGSSGDAEVLLGNGDGTFHVGNIISTGGATRTGIAAGDLNGDGLTDMVLVDSGQITSLINTTNQDTTPPTASVALTQPAVNPGDQTIQFSVTYTDNQQVDTSTLSNSNLTVTTPNGSSETATLVSTNLAPAAKVTATYSIAALSGSASQTDDGTYTVTATGNTVNAVKNANGLPVAGGQIGQFSVTVAVNLNGPNLVASVAVRNPAAAVAGTRFAGATRVTVLNSGNALAKGKIVINLYASPSATIASGTPILVSATRNINLKPGKQTAIALPGFKWPAGLAGTFFVVADVNATQTITETAYADNVATSATPTAVALPFVDIDNLWTGKLPATLKVGRRTPLAVALQNIGNTAARATATYTVQAVDASNASTTIGSGSVRIVAAAHGRQAVSIPLTVPTTLTLGTYHIVITISYPGDTNAGNDSATSATTFTV
jgi:hypothetical protein